MLNPFITGYHGTTLSNATNILRQNKMNTTDEDYHWLGVGAYFFENAPIRAWQFAKNHVCKSSDELPAVIGAKIDMSQSMDLLDITHWNGIKDLHDDLYKEDDFPEQCGPIILDSVGNFHGIVDCPSIEGRFYGDNVVDCKIINKYIVNYEKKFKLEVNAIRYAFIEGMQIYPQSFFFDHNHIQIAVQNPDILSDLFLFDSDKLEKMFLETGITRWPVTVRKKDLTK